MGGKTAMMFSSFYPKSIRNLIIVDILPINYKSNFRIILSSLNSIDLDKFSSRREVDSILAKNIKEASLRGFLLKNLFRNNDNKLQFKFNLKTLNSKFHEVENSINLVLPFNKKTLFIKGENSNYINELEMEKTKKFF